MKNNHTDHTEENRTLSSIMQKNVSINAIAGLSVGTFSTGIFHPFEKALYLSVVNHAPFFSIHNFQHPFHGLSQSVVQRAVIGGTYFFFQGEFDNALYPYLRNHLEMSELVAHCMIGSLAGSLNGVMTNGMSAVKYYTWLKPGRSFLTSVGQMWSSGCFRPFFNGSTATIGRELLFGVSYEVTRHFLQARLAQSGKADNKALYFFSNFLSAGLGVAIAAPFNYARNIQYATPPHEKTATTLKILSNLYNETKKANMSSLHRLSFFSEKFKLGPATLLVATKIGFNQALFDTVKAKISSLT